MSANRRRRTVLKSETPVPVQAPTTEPEPAEEILPVDTDTEQEGDDMGDQFEGYKTKAVEAEAPAKQVMVALSRCRYKSGASIVDAEAGDEIKNCDPIDLKDLEAHNCVETFDAEQVQALFSLRGKDADAKQRLARAIGII